MWKLPILHLVDLLIRNARYVGKRGKERKKKELVKVVVDGELTCDRSIESRRNLEP